MPTATADGAGYARMRRVTDPGDFRRWCERTRACGLTLGLVPTMGALHAGHRSLIRRSVGESDRTAVTIFVNPTQFGIGEDYGRYPRSLEADMALCAEAGADLVYAPSVEAMYPPGSATGVRVTGPLTESLEGAHRPGHFEGVATVVAKLLMSARPDRAYFGHKDAQQCAVVRRLAADLDSGCEIVVCATVRDPDGLALSSRNAYLSPEARRQALAIPRALAAAAALHRAGEDDTRELIRSVERGLAASPDLSVDYVAAVDPDSLAPLSIAGDRCEIIIAARMQGTRLIDAVTLGADEGSDVGDRGPEPPLV